MKGECEEEEGLSSNDSVVDALRKKSCTDEKSGVTSKQEKKIISSNIPSESTKYEQRAIIEEVKEEDFFVPMNTSGPLFLSSCVE